MNLTDVTALVGAATGALALALSVFQELRHRKLARPKLLVTAFVGYEVSPADIAAISWQRGRAGVPTAPIKISGQEPRLCFKLRNAGRRTIHVVSFGGDVMGADRHFLDEDAETLLPRSLQEGQRHVFWRSARLLEEEKAVTSLWVQDSMDTVWALPHVDFLQLQSEARKALREWKAEEKIRLEGLVERRHTRGGDRP